MTEETYSCSWCSQQGHVITTCHSISKWGTKIEMACTDFGFMLCDSNNKQYPCYDTEKLPLIYNNIPSVAKKISLGNKYIADHTVVFSTKFMPDNICVETY